MQDLYHQPYVRVLPRSILTGNKWPADGLPGKEWVYHGLGIRDRAPSLNDLSSVTEPAT